MNISCHCEMGIMDSRVGGSNRGMGRYVKLLRAHDDDDDEDR